MADAHLEKFLKLAEASAGSDGFDALRKVALESLKATGFPTMKTEGWRKTDLREALAIDYAPAPDRGKHVPHSWWRKGLDECRLVPCANGRWNPRCSNLNDLPEGVYVYQLSSEDWEADAFGSLADVENPFVALNTASLEDAVVIVVEDGVALDKPLHLYHQRNSESGDIFSNQRVYVQVGKGSSLTLVESFSGCGEGKYMTSAVTEILVGDNANVKHVRIQDEKPDSFHMGSTWVTQGRDSRFESHALNFGSKTARHDIQVNLNGSNAECVVNGLYLGGEDQVLDTHSQIHHREPNCRSNQLYRGILDGTAKGIFNGLVYVHAQAQLTDARQNNSAILMSDDAQIFTEPQLEIYADDSFNGLVYVDDFALKFLPQYPFQYDTWAVDNSVGAADADDDGDGLDNLYEYALGGNPKSSLKPLLPAFIEVTHLFEYSHLLRNDDLNRVCTVETCSNLMTGTWGEAGIVTVTNGTVGAYDDVTHAVPIEEQAFLRIKVETSTSIGHENDGYY